MNKAKEAYLASILKPGELYAGILLGKDGQPDYHLILLPGEADDVAWAEAKTFATEVGGELPTLREQSLLFANLRGEFKPNWYWSGEQRASDSAWTQSFSTGSQSWGYTAYKCRARAVCRIPIWERVSSSRRPQSNH